jgi:hypothetical protein
MGESRNGREHNEHSHTVKDPLDAGTRCRTTRSGFLMTMR